MSEGASLHVLVTEDDCDLRSALVELLDSEGIGSTCVSTVEDTRRALTSTPDAVLLLDLHFSGTELTAADWLKSFEQHGDAPRTLLLSASSHGRALADRFGVPFVRKPFDFDELVQEIRRVSEAGTRPRDSAP